MTSLNKISLFIFEMYDTFNLLLGLQLDTHFNETGRQNKLVPSRDQIPISLSQLRPFVRCRTIFSRMSDDFEFMTNDNDPAADFLARESEELGELGEELGISNPPPVFASESPVPNGHIAEPVFGMRSLSFLLKKSSL